MTGISGNRKPIAPTVETSDDDLSRRVTRHPAFALASFGVIDTANGQDLFGAAIRPSKTIRLKLARAHQYYSGSDYYAEDGIIAEVDMSEAQFTQLITQFNRGVGTPVTMRLGPEQGSKIVAYPQITPVDIIERVKTDVDEKLANELKRIREVFEELSVVANSEGAISKKALREKMRTMEFALANLPGNLEFFGKQMRGEVDKVFNEASMNLHTMAQGLGPGEQKFGALGFQKNTEGQDEAE